MASCSICAASLEPLGRGKAAACPLVTSGSDLFSFDITFKGAMKQID